MTKMSGAGALASGAIQAGVSLVTSYAGGPATAIVNHILASTSPGEVQVEWTSNEKVAIEMAFGASVGGMRALLCVKGVGLNIALDPLMAINLCGCYAGLVILVGDDPGAWGSQNEQDSRALALAAELPLFEPATVVEARVAMVRAFQLSETLGLPVIVRVTRALVLAQAEIADFEQTTGQTSPPAFAREFMRWVVLPINVVPYHRRLRERLARVQRDFETSLLNGIEGEGAFGLIAAGFAYQKLLDALAGKAVGPNRMPPEVRILRLGTIHPLPTALVAAFLRGIESVLVLEEGLSWVEQMVRNVAQSSKLALPVYGRDSGHVPGVGELFGPHIAAVLNDLVPGLALPTSGETSRPMPSRQGLCDGCPYISVFDALTGAMDQAGGRDAFIVVGDPGCMVRAQLPPYKLLDIKSSLGSSIATAAGTALSLAKRGLDKRVVAICGDSALYHSGFAGLVDAVRLGVTMAVLVLDNSTTALSGGQPHPGSRADARGNPRHSVDLEMLVRAAGVDELQVVDVAGGDDMGDAIQRALGATGIAAIIARGPCPKWVTAQG
ncbi:MAG: indolepyruvate ferredoxin oxidoreductase subunit alpha [Anaerolineae bacterium]|nr:indolepyruvate ferredoxin oxidoreductase subunit alpha [Anaerolineae bacterium]